MYRDDDGISGQSQSAPASSYKDQPSDDESTSSSSSSTSSAERRKNTNTAASAAMARMNHQQQYEQDRLSDMEDDMDDAGEARGLLSNMDHPERNENVAGLSSSEVAKQRQKRRKFVAGVAGGVAGLVMIGPCTAVAAGVAGAMLIKKLDRKKEKEALTLTDNTETELASLLSPKAQV